jgi:uncharacterized protein YbjT (DUF2867 family)
MKSMKVAITGGTGFVGRHLAYALVSQGHEVVLLARGVDRRDETVRRLPGVTWIDAGVSQTDRLIDAFQGCDAVAHLAGINRESGDQTFDVVHVQGTRNVVEAARVAGVGKIAFLSFLRARPDCGSPYHESKFAAEEIVRASGLDYTILKAGVIYGDGDHLLDHVSHALYTFPVFLLVGYQDQPVRPLAVQDLVDVLRASLVDGRLSRATVPVTGPEELTLEGVVRRIMLATGKKRPIFRAPVAFHLGMAMVLEGLMSVPLVASAQVRILTESLTEPLPWADPLPADLAPGTRFTIPQIRRGLPQPRAFGLRDCRCASRLFHRTSR